MRTREPASFWRDYSRRHSTTSFGGKWSYWRKQVIKSFIILRSWEGLTSFNTNNRANFSGEIKKKTVKWGFPGCRDERKKPFFQISSSSSNLKVSKTSGGSREGARGPTPPLIFRPNLRPKGRKLETASPYLGVWVTLPPPPLFCMSGSAIAYLFHC